MILHYFKANNNRVFVKNILFFQEQCDFKSITLLSATERCHSFNTIEEDFNSDSLITLEMIQGKVI